MAIDEPSATSPLLVFLQNSGLISSRDTVSFAPLTGGVSSDIWRVVAGSRTLVVKQALSKLRVAKDWEAPLSRNAAEVLWLRKVRTILPDAVPDVLAHDPELGAFAMEFLPSSEFPVWKAELQNGNADPDFSSTVGRSIAAIHSATANDPSVAAAFANDDAFQALRLDPYLEATAAAHPALAHELRNLSVRTIRTHLTLVHGDVSPKNILKGAKGPVFLDAECAWYGDPAFDLAFCLNHLLLKCVWVPGKTDAFLNCFDAMAGGYFEAVDWESKDELESRAASLLPALLLGRIDGKSPVEYITTDVDKAKVRNFASDFLIKHPNRLAEIRAAWAQELKA
ncbi:MAG TPA: aminoglycoside phosphotransferase family protein [Afipia sp.]